MDIQEDHSLVIERQDFRGSLVVLSVFVAFLLWWIGIYGYITVGAFQSGTAGFLAFLAVPVLVTGATYLLARRHKRPAQRVNTARHRSS